MNAERITDTAKIWLWSNGTSPASWHFVTITGKAAEAIRAHEAVRRLEFGKGRGFGSVKVAATIGATSWSTSVFPSKSADGFLLPVKLAVRKAEDLAEGDEVHVTLDLL